MEPPRSPKENADKELFRRRAAPKILVRLGEEAKAELSNCKVSMVIPATPPTVEPVVVGEPDQMVLEEPQQIVVEEPEQTVVEEPQQTVVEEPEQTVVEEPQQIDVEEPAQIVVEVVPVRESLPQMAKTMANNASTKKTRRPPQQPY